MTFDAQPSSQGCYCTRLVLCWCVRVISYVGLMQMQCGRWDLWSISVICHAELMQMEVTIHRTSVQRAAQWWTARIGEWGAWSEWSKRKATCYQPTTHEAWLAGPKIALWIPCLFVCGWLVGWLVHPHLSHVQSLRHLYCCHVSFTLSKLLQRLGNFAKASDKCYTQQKGHSLVKTGHR